MVIEMQRYKKSMIKKEQFGPLLIEIFARGREDFFCLGGLEKMFNFAL